MSDDIDIPNACDGDLGDYQPENDVTDEKVDESENPDILNYSSDKDNALKRIFRSLYKGIKGKNKAGKKIGYGLDLVGVFVPVVDKFRDAAKGLLGLNKSQTKSKPMLSKILSVKNFINMKDEQGNFSWQELGASLLQIVLAGAIVYGAVELGIWNELTQIMEQGE